MQLPDIEDLGAFGGIVLLLQEVEIRGGETAVRKPHRAARDHPERPTVNSCQVILSLGLVVCLEVESGVMSLRVQIRAGSIKRSRAYKQTCAREQRPLFGDWEASNIPPARS